MLAILLMACSRESPIERTAAELTEGQMPRKMKSVEGMVVDFLPARVVVCNPDIPYVGPNFGSNEGRNPLMMPLWLPQEHIDLKPGDWIQFDLTIDWTQSIPLQMAPNITRLKRRGRPAGCHGAILKPS